MFAQGEWYLSYGNVDCHEYAKAASGFYPSKFDADAWAEAIKASGARYVCFTTRHHDGFSMFDTEYSDYDIVDASPYKKDIVREMAEACKRHGIKFHLYYSLIDWTRDDYPGGWSAKNAGKDAKKADFDSYFHFMKNQITELIRKYDPDALWFDGKWDQPSSFDWRLDELYALIHSLKPSCLIGNNHHGSPLPGEDFQLFERDLPGENTAGYSAGQEIGPTPVGNMPDHERFLGILRQGPKLQNRKRLNPIPGAHGGKRSQPIVERGAASQWRNPGGRDRAHESHRGMVKHIR